MPRDYKTKRVADLANKNVGSTASPTFVSVTVTDLDGSRIVYSDSGSTLASTDYMQHNDTTHVTRLGNVAGGNYLEVESDGTIEFVGDATVWNDANVGAMALTLPTSSQPDEVNFVDELGADTGITTWGFAVGEKVSGAIEIPHDYDEGTNIVFHVHWQGITAPAGGTDNVQWQLIYTVSRDGTTLDAATTIVKETAITTRYSFNRSDFPTITGTNFHIGDQFLFCLSRIAASADSYAGDALIATVGFHYACDTVGSRNISTK